jgi:hypothetical protein
MKQAIVLFALAAALAGCGGSAAAPVKPAVAVNPAPAQTAPVDQSHTVISVNVYQFAVPFGSVSRSKDFWKLVSEDALDVPTDNALNRSGLRVGRANLSDWPRFREFLDRDTSYSRTSRFIALPGVGMCSLEMTPDIKSQTMFFYDQYGLRGRSFDESQNIFNFGFQWVPHQLDTIRVSVCPVVMALRQRMDYLMSNNPTPTDAIDPETMYDLSLRADIPPNQFLVIGPSLAASDPDTLGYHFLTVEHPSDRLEQIVIVVGKQVDMNKTNRVFYPVQAGTLAARAGNH